jgi:hypothetical protein
MVTMVITMVPDAMQSKKCRMKPMGECVLPQKGLREVHPTTTYKITPPLHTKANTV